VRLDTAVVGDAWYNFPVQISMTDSFVEALAALSPGDGKRAAAFLDKLLHAPDSASLRPEIVHDAGDRAIRSFKVTHDLRAIGHVEGDEVVLMYVSRHDDAYEWAKNRCIECHPVTGELQVVADPAAAEKTLASSAAVTSAARIVDGRAPESGLFDMQSDDYLLSIGVPPSWLPTIRMIYNEDMLLTVARDLPAAVADRLLRVATGELVGPVCVDETCQESGVLSREAPGYGRACAVADDEALCLLLEALGIDGLPDV